MSRIISLVIFLLIVSRASAQINTSADDYAPAFRTTDDGKMEFWFTSGRNDNVNSKSSNYGRLRAIYISACSDTGFGIPVRAPSPINQKSANESDVALDGTPSFAACDGSHGVFTSDRLVDGKYFGNDIYEMRFANGAWNVNRIDEIDSKDWDDSPALSPDGNRIYFASDRLAPGTRRADLFMSEFQNGHWSEPKYLPEVNTTEFSEETPFVAEDSYLYYSTNRSGDYDLWRAKLKPNGMPEDDGEPVPFDGVNRKGSDETHPCFSPGGGFFIYSTNFSEKGASKSDHAKKDFNIEWIKLNRPSAKIEIDVRERLRQTTERVSVPVHFVTDGHDKIISSGASAPMQLSLNDFLSDPAIPAADTKQFETIVHADVSSAKFVSSCDTLIGNRSCAAFYSHTLFLWDTATYYEPNCIDTFPIKKVQYFVTGYWCPTTVAYAKYENCPSLFMDSACLIPVCQPGQLDSFHVSVTRLHSECIDYAEFDKQGAKFSSSVDDAIDQHLKAMESAFGSACMKRTIEQGKPVRVTVEGFTDPRNFKNDCHYFGPSIDFSKSPVIGNDSMKAHLHHDARLKDYGAGGNQMLSELRAYNLALLLDKIWMDRIPQYRDLKQKGLLTTIAVGRAIDQEEIPNEQRRSAVVYISAENNDATSTSKGTIIPGQIPPPGGRVVLCDECNSKSP
jgi:hypothetical protein